MKMEDICKRILEAAKDSWNTSRGEFGVEVWYDGDEGAYYMRDLQPHSNAILLAGDTDLET